MHQSSCTDMAQLPAVMTDVVLLIFKNRKLHVVIFPNVPLISTGLAFLVVLKLDIACDSLFFQVEQVLLTGVPTGCCHFLQTLAESFPVLNQILFR